MNDPLPMHTVDGRFLGYFPEDVTEQELVDAEARLDAATEANLAFLRRAGALFNLR